MVVAASIAALRSRNVWNRVAKSSSESTFLHLIFPIPARAEIAIRAAFNSTAFRRAFQVIRPYIPHVCCSIFVE